MKHFAFLIHWCLLIDTISSKFLSRCYSCLGTTISDVNRCFAVTSVTPQIEDEGFGCYVIKSDNVVKSQKRTYHIGFYSRGALSNVTCKQIEQKDFLDEDNVQKPKGFNGSVSCLSCTGNLCNEGAGSFSKMSFLPVVSGMFLYRR